MTAIIHPIADAYLSGRAIAAGARWTVTPKKLHDFHTSKDGSIREVAVYNGGADFPLYRVKYEGTLDYTTLTEAAAAELEEVLCVPGPYELTLWQHRWCAYRGDGVTREWELPWRQAHHVILPLPGGRPPETFAAIVKLSLSGDPLTTYDLDAATYDGGDPSAGEVWCDVESQRFKLASDDTPADGDIVRVAAVPLWSVHVRETPRRQEVVGRTPRQLQWMEA